MTDLLMPTWVRLSRVEFNYLDSTGVSISPYTGIKKTASFGGDRLSASIEYTTTGGSSTAGAMERAALIAWLMQLRGKQNRGYIYPITSRRGSFPSTELISNNTFENGTTGWTSSNANLTLSVSDRVLRAYRVAVGADYTIQAAVATVTSGAVYAARLMASSRVGAMDYRLQLGTSAGAANISATSSDITTGGMQLLTGTASGTSMHFSILDGINGRAIGNYMDFPYASLTRCILVAGASQSGSSLNVDQLPTSTNGLLLPGDFFEVITSRGSELKVCTASLNSNSSGAGTIFFEPPLRGSVADNAAVIVEQPMGRFLFTGDMPQWTNEPGVFTTASAEFEEAA